MKKLTCPNCGKSVSLNSKIKTKCSNCNSMIATDAISVLLPQEKDGNDFNFDNWNDDGNWDVDLEED